MKKYIAVCHALVVMLLVACSNETIETNRTNKKKSSVDTANITIDLYVKKSCGATTPTIELVNNIISQMEADTQLNILTLNSNSEAAELKIIGVPTIRVNGIDIDPTANQIQKYGIT